MFLLVITFSFSLKMLEVYAQFGGVAPAGVGAVVNTGGAAPTGENAALNVEGALPAEVDAGVAAVGGCRAGRNLTTYNIPSCYNPTSGQPCAPTAQQKGISCLGVCVVVLPPTVDLQLNRLHQGTDVQMVLWGLQSLYNNLQIDVSVGP